MPPVAHDSIVTILPYSNLWVSYSLHVYILPLYLPPALSYKPTKSSDTFIPVNLAFKGSFFMSLFCGETIELHRIEMTALSQRTAPGVHSGRVPL